MNTYERILDFAEHCSDYDTLANVVLNAYISGTISMDDANRLMHEFGFANINTYWLSAEDIENSKKARYPNVRRKI